MKTKINAELLQRISEWERAQDRRFVSVLDTLDGAELEDAIEVLKRALGFLQRLNGDA